jgi:hypothetical protein
MVRTGQDSSWVQLDRLPNAQLSLLLLDKAASLGCIIGIVHRLLDMGRNGLSIFVSHGCRRLGRRLYTVAVRGKKGKGLALLKRLWNNGETRSYKKRGPHGVEMRSRHASLQIPRKARALGHRLPNMVTRPFNKTFEKSNILYFGIKLGPKEPEVVTHQNLGISGLWSRITLYALLDNHRHRPLDQA